MTKSSLRTLLSAIVCAVAVGLGLPASAQIGATFTFSDQNCSDFAYGGSPGARTLTCVVAGPPTCTVTGPTTGVINTPITLTAACSPAATSWTWTGGNCAGSSATCAANATQVGSVPYTVQGSNANGPGPVSPTFSVNWTNALQAPANCTITANGVNPLGLPIGGGAVNLIAACTSGGAPTLYDWTGGTIAVNNSGSATQSTNITGTTIFTVTPKNATGSGNTASVTVNVAVQQAAGLCSQYPDVSPTTVVSWGQAATWTTGASGGFPANRIWVLQVTVPPSAPNSTTAGRFQVSEYQGLPTTRQLTISSQACDFRFPDYRGVNGPLTWSNGSTATTYFGVVSAGQVGTTGSMAGLVAGQTYYVNIRNWDTDLNAVSCPAGGSCNAAAYYGPSAP